MQDVNPYPFQWDWNWDSCVMFVSRQVSHGFISFEPTIETSLSTVILSLLNGNLQLNTPH